MSARWSKEESALLDLLRAAMGKENKIEHKDANKIERNIDCDWERLLHLAESHAVTAMLYDVLEEQTGTAACIWERVQKSAQITVLSNYRLLFLTAYVTDYLGQYGIAAVTLKGAATAVLYPVPEYRKSGDVDLLIPLESEYKRALRLLQQAGFLADEEQLALHHTDLRNAEGISIELHHTLVEPFENQKVNEYLKNILPEYGNHIVENTAWGVRLLQPADAYHAFYLIVHMLQHFLREGFGLKNLCDWTLFWNREVAVSEKEQFMKLIKQSKTEQFVQILTAACVRYLGLQEEKVSFLMKERAAKERIMKEREMEPIEPIKASAWDELIEDFMQDVLQAGEFGRSQTDRMVAMRATGFLAYVKEFHHQMHLNFPKAGRVIVCWPFLWIVTLVRFLYNNHRFERASVRSILKKTAQRSELMERMRLFW